MHAAEVVLEGEPLKLQYPRGTAQVAIPEGEPLTVAKAAVPPRTPPYRPRKKNIACLRNDIKYTTGLSCNVLE